MGCEFAHQLLNLITALNTSPEEDFTISSQAAISLVEKPGKVFVVMLDCPHEFRKILFDARKDIVRHIGEPSRFCYSECC